MKHFFKIERMENQKYVQTTKIGFKQQRQHLAPRIQMMTMPETMKTMIQRMPRLPMSTVQSLTRLPTQQTQRVLEFALMIPEVELNWAQRPLRAALSTNSLLITEPARANDALFPYFFRSTQLKRRWILKYS